MPAKKLEKKVKSYRIKQLSELSGISRETIRFYINEGLVPPPIKTSKNMGWYNDKHLELLQLIQKLQKERFLPLKVIKSLIHGDDDEAFDQSQTMALAEIRKRLISDHKDLVVSTDPAKVADELQLSKTERRELLQLGLSRNGIVTSTDVEIAQLWMQIRDAGGLTELKGFSPKDLIFVRTLVDEAVVKELEIFRQRFKSLTPEEASRLLDVVVPALSKMFGILHLKRINEHVEALFEHEELKSH